MIFLFLPGLQQGRAAKVEPHALDSHEWNCKLCDYLSSITLFNRLPRDTFKLVVSQFADKNSSGVYEW